MTRWALITGTSTGIGRALVLELLRRGAAVFAGVRRADDGAALVAEAAAGARLVPLILDVTDAAAIDAAFARVDEVTGAGGLWALVNNAGVAVPGTFEHLTREEWQKQFEINLFAPLELTKRAIPRLRRAAAVLGAGVPRVMLVSSIGGRVPQPFLAPYTGSKSALTSIGDSMRLELRGQGIGVTVLEPGAIATPLWTKGDRDAERFTPDHPAREHYGAGIDGIARLARKAARNAIPAEKAAAVAADALFARRAPARVLIGADAKGAAFLKQWLPLAWFDRLLRRELGLK